MKQNRAENPQTGSPKSVTVYFSLPHPPPREWGTLLHEELLHWTGPFPFHFSTVSLSAHLLRLLKHRAISLGRGAIHCN